MSQQNPVVVAGQPSDWPTTPIKNLPLSSGGSSVVVSGTVSVGSVTTPSAVKPFDSQSNRYQQISPNNEAIVEETTRLLGGTFRTAIDTNFWTFANNGAASAAGVSNYVATLTSGTANSGYGYFTSVGLARYLFSDSNVCRIAARLVSTGGAGTTRLWGVINFTGSPPALSDGFYFSYDGSSSTLSVNSISGGVVTNAINSGSFNGQTASYTVDTNVHFYEIVYDISGAWFYVDGVLLHTMTPTTVQLSQNMTLGLTALCQNSLSGTTSASLEIWTTAVIRLGQSNPHPSTAHINSLGTTTLKLGPGSFHRLIINTPGSNNNTLTIYDNTTNSGKIVAVVNGTATSGATVASLDYEADFFIGLTIVNANGSSGDYTFVYE